MMGNILSNASDGVSLMVGEKNFGTKRDMASRSFENFKLAQNNLESFNDLEIEAKDSGSRAFLQAGRELDQLFYRESKSLHLIQPFGDEENENVKVKRTSKFVPLEFNSKEGDEILASNHAQFQPEISHHMELLAENSNSRAFLEADQIFDEIFDRAIGRQIGPIYATQFDAKPGDLQNQFIPEDAKKKSNTPNGNFDNAIITADLESMIDHYFASLLPKYYTKVVDQSFRRILEDDED